MRIQKHNTLRPTNHHHWKESSVLEILCAQAQVLAPADEGITFASLWKQFCNRSS